jgi:hypothetical protein
MTPFRTSAVAFVLLLGASPLALANGIGANAGSSSMPSSHQGTASPGGSISQSQAMKEIQLDGYTNVQDLHKAANGWTAKAAEGGKPITVMVDNSGNVWKMQSGSGMAGRQHRTASP